MQRALVLAVGFTLAGCATAPIPCPSDASSDVSLSIHDGDWTDATLRQDTGAQTSSTCKAIVSGPLVSPNYRRVGWVEDRGDHRMFVVEGEPVAKLRGDTTYLSVGLDGARTWYLLAPRLQMFVHAEQKDGELHWDAMIECPSCSADGGTRYFDVRPSGPLSLDASPDGAFTLLTVPGRAAHTQVFVLDTKTPKREPTVDRYLAAADDAERGGKLRFGTRVWIGASEGPVFDAVRVDSFTRDASGSIHYEGARGNVVYDVIDNVLGARLATSVPVRVE